MVRFGFGLKFGRNFLPQTEHITYNIAFIFSQSLTISNASLSFQYSIKGMGLPVFFISLNPPLIIVVKDGTLYFTFAPIINLSCDT